MTTPIRLTDTLRNDYTTEFSSMVVSPSKLLEANSVAKTILDNKARYLAIEKATGVPWFMVAVLHWREASGNFHTYLGDGEPLTSVTHCVPRGRGPFASWEAGAIDALTHE